MTLNHNETSILAMRYKQILLGLILFVLLGGFLQITSKFHFFYIEQLQLFQFSGDYLTDKISNPGGLSLIIGEFLTQFFITPYAAFYYRSYTYVYRIDNESDHPANQSG